MDAASAALRGAVLAYQWTLRPVLGCNCRFHPSCSDYALEALRGEPAPAEGEPSGVVQVLRRARRRVKQSQPVPAEGLPAAAAAAVDAIRESPGEPVAWLPDRNTQADVPEPEPAEDTAAPAGSTGDAGEVPAV